MEEVVIIGEPNVIPQPGGIGHDQRDRPKPVTLEVLANQLGMHVSTVSRALSSSDAIRAGVAAQTVQRVRELADKLGYLPDPAGTSLRTGRTKTIGVLVPRLTDLVLATIYEGIDEFAATAGFRTLVANTGDEPRVQQARLDAFIASRVEGVVLGDGRTDVGVPRACLKSGIPFVLVSRRLPRTVSVTTDDLRGGRIAARHIFELGHRVIGIIAGEPYASTGVERTRGFRMEMANLGVSISDEYVLHSRFDVAGGDHAARRLLRLTPRPTALFAVNDFAAIGAMAAIRDLGLMPGEDIALIGYNDISIAGSLPVGLSTIRSPMLQMGRVAAELLIRLINGENVKSRRFRPELVPRYSTLGSTPTFADDEPEFFQD